MCFPPARSIPPPASTVPEWQRAQSVLGGCGKGGGAPWHELHAVGPADTAVQVGVVVEPPAASVAPWQYVDAHVVPVQLGVAPWEARPVNGSEIVPFTCVRSVTGAWQSLQANALRIVPVTTCFWCAPTARCVVSVSPFVPTGGAGFTPSVPWHAVQPPAETCTVPSMCWPPATSIAPLARTVPSGGSGCSSCSRVELRWRIAVTAAQAIVPSTRSSRSALGVAARGERRAVAVGGAQVAARVELPASCAVRVASALHARCTYVGGGSRRRWA